MREPKPGLWEGGQGKGRAVTEVSAAPRRSDGEEDLGLGRRTWVSRERCIVNLGCAGSIIS